MKLNSPQEYYDRLVQCVEDGTFPATFDGSCNYRVPDEPHKRCAVSICIDDCDYSPSMERNSVMDSVFDGVIAKILPTGLTRVDLYNVQLWHDTSAAALDFAPAFLRGINDLPCFAECNKSASLKFLSQEEEKTEVKI